MQNIFHYNKESVHVYSSIRTHSHAHLLTQSSTVNKKCCNSHVVCSTMLCLEYLCEFIHLVGGSVAIECDLTTLNERYMTAARLVLIHTENMHDERQI